jgi:thermitase
LRQIKLAFAGLLLFQLSSSASAAPALVRAHDIHGKSMDALSSHVLIKYKAGRAAACRTSILSKYGVKSKKQENQIGVETLPVPAGETVDSFLEILKSDPNVEFAEPNGIYRAFVDPNDTLYSSQYYLQEGTTPGSINVEDAWDITTGSTTIVVAVVDTGVTLTHTDLAANLWTNPSTTSISGLHGATMEINWDEDLSCSETDISLGPEQCDNPNPTDDATGVFHGTHVAGIIAAVTNNNSGIAGIAQNCRIMAVKALNSDGNGSFESIANGILYAVNNGAHVINLSLGGSSGSSTIQAAIDYAIANGIVVVAASGNDAGSVNFPAAYEPVIAVGATDENDEIADFSSRGPELDLVAPGVNILSTNQSGTSTEDGTSFATPMVAAVAALIRSINPSMSITNITRYIDFYADDLGAGGFDNTYGYGRLNAFKAVQAAQAGTPFITVPSEPNETFSYPNPFRPTGSTSLTINIPQTLGASNIKIDIMNTAGEKIKTLDNTNSWDGRNDDGNFVASGFYFYYVKTDLGNTKGKLTVIK